MLSQSDLLELKDRGITQAQIEQQLNQFKQGFPILNIIKASTIKDGIKALTSKDIEEHIKVYEDSAAVKKVKFTPASGAASRMFKKLYEVIDNYKGTEEDYLNIMSDRDFQSINYTCNNIKNFAFYSDLVQNIESRGVSIDNISKNKDFPFLLKSLLGTEGLNYGNLPKGLLKFHRTSNGENTPTHEHLIEGVLYATTGNEVFIHFTVSSAHINLFKQHINTIKPIIEEVNKVKFDISYSIQKLSTDTIAVDINNEPVRDNNNNLIFRPGGHGALIYNLNDIDADIIFIKNIDNIIQNRLIDDTVKYKKALAGILLSIRKKVSEYYHNLNTDLPNSLIDEIDEFVSTELCIIPPEGFDKWEKGDKIEYLKNKINRPIRVCGMVKNQGEPGGGPFWVKNIDGSISLQIVESSQFSDEQKSIMHKSTHFNPVDLVCSTKDFNGKNYNLIEFVDNNTGFISSKSLNGKDIKALELPGLWNGAMANWNTIFAEVPASTFNPVKTLNDLLRAEHLYEQDFIMNNNNNNETII